MEHILDFLKGTAKATRAPAWSGLKPSNTLGRQGAKPRTPISQAPKARKLDAGIAKPLAKHLCSSKNIEVVVVALSKQDKEDLDILLECDEDKEMDDGTVNEGNNDNTTGTWKTQCHPEEAKSQIITFFFDPEMFLKDMEDRMGVINQLVILLMGVMTKCQISDYICGVLTHYHTFNQLVMVTGGGKDDMLTREEME
ncbi:hypothetical protein FS749_011989 [Ceratobasidium sp. UAMH 11750]|nr:hypothetical protein FS749_011989 [Ceratobasidium sp. UAMH 11750]